MTLEEVKEPVDNGPRPWNEPKIPMQEQKSQRQKIDEAIGTIKVRLVGRILNISAKNERQQKTFGTVFSIQNSVYFNFVSVNQYFTRYRNLK